jgi:hypothetical protein
VLIVVVDDDDDDDDDDRDPGRPPLPDRVDVAGFIARAL